MRRLMPALAALMTACAPQPQDTRINQAPAWVRPQAPVSAPAVTPPATSFPRSDREWFVNCFDNAVTTEAECFAQRWVGRGQMARVSFIRLRSGQSFGPHVSVSHRWPILRVRPTVRVDGNRPVDLDREGMGRSCDVVRQMKTGSTMLVQAGDWPRCEACVQYAVGLDNFAGAYEEARRRAGGFGIRASCPGDPPLR